MPNPILCELRVRILQGWPESGRPESSRELHKDLQPYWLYRDELSVENGILFKGDRILIPKSMQTETLEKIHYGHQGSDECKLRTKTCVFWSGINSDIDEIMQQCAMCQELQKSQCAESLMPHTIPVCPWQILATDIFNLNTRQLVRVQDHDTRKWTPAIVRQACAEPRSYIIETPTGQVLRRNRWHLKEDVSNSNKTLTSLYNTSIHQTELPPTNIPNTHPAEKPNTHTDICTPSEVTHRYSHQMQPSGNTASETITRSSRVIQPIKSGHTKLLFFSELTEPCLNHISNERGMSDMSYLPLEEAVTFLVWISRGASSIYSHSVYSVALTS